MEWCSSSIPFWALKEKKIQREGNLPYLISQEQIAESTIIQKIMNQYSPVGLIKWVCSENKLCSSCPRFCCGHLGVWFSLIIFL